MMILTHLHSFNPGWFDEFLSDEQVECPDNWPPLRFWHFMSLIMTSYLTRPGQIQANTGQIQGTAQVQVRDHPIMTLLQYNNWGILGKLYKSYTQYGKIFAFYFNIIFSIFYCIYIVEFMLLLCDIDIYHSGFSCGNIMIEMSEEWAALWGRLMYHIHIEI